MTPHILASVLILSLLPASATGTPESSVSITVDSTHRVIVSNGIPDHPPGTFPRPGNPNTIAPQSHRFRMPLKPTISSIATPAAMAWWGVAINGVPFEPGTAEAWNNDRRSGWRYEAATGFLDLGLDEHRAHVQPTGAYHYHALPTGLVKNRGGDATQMLLLGWAADGFPIYTDRGHQDPLDFKSPLITLRSGWKLKAGNRLSVPGGPTGAYDGRFTEDFEYVPGAGDLDPLNGRFAKTPEYPDGTYCYHITRAFPFIPRSWKGEPDPSFQKLRGGGGPRPGLAPPPPPRGGRLPR